MSNNYFNFNIPEFHDKQGKDWSSFTTIVNSEVDTLIKKITELYWLNDINFMSTPQIEAVMNALKLSYESTDTLQMKKIKLRSFVSKYKNKSLEDTYLDPQESIVGTRGVIYDGNATGSFKWGSSKWGSSATEDVIKWTETGPQFSIYVDVKTSDSTMLDQIQDIYQDPSMIPAFYQIYLIDFDSTQFDKLRTI